MLHSNVERK